MRVLWAWPPLIAITCLVPVLAQSEAAVSELLDGLAQGEVLARENAAESVAALDSHVLSSRRVSDILLSALAREDSDDVSRVLVEALAKGHGQHAGKLLASRLLRTRNQAQKLRLVWSIGLFCETTEAAAPDLFRSLVEDDDRALREAACAALALIQRWPRDLPHRVASS